MNIGKSLTARVIALSWAGFWTVFFVAESLAWHTPFRLAFPWITGGLLLVFLALIPLRLERTGGLLLIVTGLTGMVAYTIWSPPGLPVASRVLATIVFSAPPVLAGSLFLMHF